ncbi:glycosyltransferase family 4 protein [Dyella sp. C9]|uniref:glycosyltransferase family 4 protein n=1 Tax=Dyella sp. C9 TaxID=2202154 RepID=UPI000DEF7211|nr:glycosyltransferase family 4 protein [Dyella sp. C9]
MTHEKITAKIAIVHDWLTTYAGAERVLEQLLLMYPAADLYAVCDFMPSQERNFLHGRPCQTTFIQHLPGARKHYRQYLPLMPLAIEQLDLSSYDIVISSSHAVAKGVLTGPDQLHVSYVHTPIRYAWDLQHQYLKESDLTHNLKGWVARYLLHRIRTWDCRTANGVDSFVVNSQYIGRRVNKVYRRTAKVVYPPVDTDAFKLGIAKDDFFLTASRLVPYKRVDLIAETFTQLPDKRLVIIGDGPERSKIERFAKGHANIQFLGYQPRNVLIDYMRRAKAFIFAAEEDFGIIPVEAQACGTPVIAFGRGGAVETIRDIDTNRPTGVLFPQQSISSISAAIARLENSQINPIDCNWNAQHFSIQNFRSSFAEALKQAHAAHQVLHAP